LRPWPEKWRVSLGMCLWVAGESHVCGLNSSGYLVCRESIHFGQIDDVPEGRALDFFGLVLGIEHSCYSEVRWFCLLLLGERVV